MDTLEIDEVFPKLKINNKKKGGYNDNKNNEYGRL